MRFTIPVIAILFKNEAAVTNMRQDPKVDNSTLFFNFLFAPFPYSKYGIN